MEVTQELFTDEMREVRKHKRSKYDDMSPTWIKKHKGRPEVIEFIESQWRYCEMAPPIFNFHYENPKSGMLSKNRWFLRKNFSVENTVRFS